MATPGLNSSLFNPSPSERRQLLFGAVALSSVLLFTLVYWPRIIFSESYLPHAYCYLQKPSLVWTHVAADSVIGLSYLAISITLAYFVYRGRRDVPFLWIILQFGLFIVACGGTHFMEVVTVWIPMYVLAAGVKGFTALASVTTAVGLPVAIPRALAMIRSAKEGEAYRLALESALAERDSAQVALERTNDRLEQQVRERTRELEIANDSLKMEIGAASRLRVSLAQLASIVESSDDAIIGKDLGGNITSWNKGAERLYGYSAAEAIGQPVTIISPWDHRQEISEIMLRIVRGEHVQSYETQRATKDGALLDVSLTVSPIKDAGGAIVGASAIARDITTSKRAEEALHASETQYRLLFERNPLPLWVFDRSSLAFLAVNDAAIRHYGYKNEEFNQMTVVDLSPSDEIPAALRHWSKRAPSAQPMGTWRHVKKDGTVIDVEITANDLSFRGVDAELVLANDITERLKAEELLRESKERFAKVFRTSPLGITISTEAEGRYIDVNPAFLAMLEYERHDVIGRTITDLKVWVDPLQREVMLQQLDSSSPMKITEARFRTRSGQIRLVQVAAERIHLENQDSVLSIVQDITDTRRLEHQFLHSQKMEAVGRLAGGVAHDFNNLLGVIIGYCEIARPSLTRDHPASKSLDQISKAAERAAVLTRQLLAFSRRQVLQPTVLNLNSVVHNMSKMLLRVIGEHISLAFRPGEPLGSVRADLSQVEQIVMNLVVNARDAMPEGGKLILETANVELDGSSSQRDEAVKAGSYVMIAISDDGVGMDTTTLSRIFEPFFTTKGPSEGTGLGLSTVYGIVNQSGGYVWAYSEPNRGTTFKIYLPRIDEPAESLVPSAISSEIPTGTETILVVEDDTPLRTLTVALLDNAGYNVLQAEDAKSALEIEQDHHEQIHLLLSDVIMPGARGPDLAADLRRRRPDIKVLYMSGYLRDLLNKPELLGPAGALLPKPFSRATLLHTVRAILDNQSPR